MKRIFFIVYCILAAVAVSAEHTVPVKFRHIGISEGLPDNYVKKRVRIARRTSGSPNDRTLESL